MEQWSGHAARLFFVETAVQISIQGEITQLQGQRLFLRCIPPRGLELGGRCALVLEQGARLFRARGQLEALNDLGLELRLLTKPTPVERRMYGRVELVGRLRVERWGGQIGPWMVEDMELSPSGLKLLAPLSLEFEERVKLSLHLPGMGGGQRFELSAEVARKSEEGDPPFIAFQFLDVDGATLLELVDVVDQRLLGLTLGQQPIKLA